MCYISNSLSPTAVVEGAQIILTDLENQDTLVSIKLSIIHCVFVYKLFLQF